MKVFLDDFQRNISLARFTTFRIGGKAKYFFIAKNKDELKETVLTAKRKGLPFFILGNGSNILINDCGFDGVAIKNEARSFKIKGNKIFVESGAILDRVINVAISVGLTGLEKGSGIPGTIGGAVYGNAGWPASAPASAGRPKKGWEIGDVVEEVELLTPNGKIKNVGNKWMQFKYRESRLKKIKGEKPVILEIVLKLKPAQVFIPSEARYRRVSRGAKTWADKNNKKEVLQKKRQEILKERTKKIPLGFSSGSIFKNPLLAKAGFLIDNCGLKGFKKGGAKISEFHANFIINNGKAKAKDILFLINLAKKEVYKKFKVRLQKEIEFIGF